MKKQIIFIILIGILLLVLPITANADPAIVDSGTCGTNISWVLDDQSVLTVSGNGAVEPDSSNSYPWNSYKDEIEKVVIEEGITSLGYHAFSGCSALTEIEFPSTLLTISSHAFDGCTSITGIMIPNNVTSIGEGAFQNTSITSITLPFVGKSRSATAEEGPLGYIFGMRESYSPATPEIDLPVTYQYLYTDGSVKKYYWYYVPAMLRTVIITDTTRIPEGAFRNCADVSVNIQCTINEIGEYVFRNCKGLNSLSFLDGVTKIPDYAFEQCTSLQDVTLQRCVTEIGDHAFAECKNLTTVSLPDNLLTIGSYAFSGCSALKGIELPSALATVSSYAFDGCTGITDIEVPKSVTGIGEGAFRNIPLISITLPFVGSSRTAIAKEGLFGFVFGYTITSTEDLPFVDIPVTLTLQYLYIDQFQSYYYWYFIPETLRTVQITDTARIPESAFINCIGFSVNIRSKVNEIGGHAFCECKGPNTLAFLGEIAEIPAYAFYKCTALQDASLPDTVTEIGERAFFNCENLETVHLSENLLSIGVSAFYRCTALQTVTIPNSLTEISESTFSYCTNLTSVILSDNLVSIGHGAFSECSALTEIEFPSTLLTISSHAFDGCTSITGIMIPNNVTSIGEGAFQNTSITSITLPFVGKSRSATAEEGPLGYIFGMRESYSPATPEIDLPVTYQYLYTDGSVKKYYWYYVPAMLRTVIITDTTRIPEGAFRNCADVSVNIQCTINEIGEYVFRNCKGLNSLSFLDGVTKIPDYAFEQCTSLQDVTLQRCVTEIGDHAFAECKNLTTVSLPDNLLTIGSYAFAHCTSITDIAIPNSVTSIGYGVLQDTLLTGISLPFVGESRTAVSEKGTLGYIFGYTETDSSVQPTVDLPVIHQYPCTYSSGSKYYWYFIPSTLQTVQITDAVRISEGAFRNCSALESVVLHEGIESIGDYAFLNCGISYLQIPDSVLSISDNAFSDSIVLYMYAYTFAESWAKTRTLQYHVIDYCLFSEMGGTVTIPENHTMVINDTYNMPTIVTPLLDYIEIEYSSSDSSVADIDENGEIVAVSTGTARISVVVDDVVAYCDVTVSRFSGMNGKVIIPESLVMFVGDSCQLQATVSPVTNTLYVNYFSTDREVVTVDYLGNLTAVGVGNARIGASIDDVTAYCEIRVVSQVITALSFDNDIWVPVTLPVPIDNIVYTPEDAVTSFSWSVGNDSIAFVDENGYITGNIVGTTELTVVDSLTGLSATTEVRVCPPVLSVSINEQELSLGFGESFDLETTVKMRNLTCTDRLVLYESSNEAVVKVNKKTGVCKAVGPGTVVITVSSANGKFATCTVVVEQLNILNIPANTKVIESEAFTGLPNVHAIRIPGNVMSIATDAIDKKIILLIPAGSEWIEWAQINGYTVIEE